MDRVNSRMDRVNSRTRLSDPDHVEESVADTIQSEGGAAALQQVKARLQAKKPSVLTVLKQARPPQAHRSARTRDI